MGGAREIRFLGAGLLAMCWLAVPGVAQASVGSSGLGDPLYPRLGNGGYDVQNYDLDLDYFPGTKSLDATATISSISTETLNRFSLDFRDGLRAKSVQIDGLDVRFKQKAKKLVISPEAAIPDGSAFEAEIAYRGKPGRHHFAVRDGGPIGWVPTKDGAWVANQPDGASEWFPSNDHPSDKATFTISIEVPKRLTAVSNGTLIGTDRLGPRTAWTWRMDQPMATYLATATIGRFELDQDPLGGLPSVIALDPTSTGDPAAQVREYQPGITQTYIDNFGAYPFSATGAIIDIAPPSVKYALETQTRPLYSVYTKKGGHPAFLNAGLIAHEVAHMWFGDSVSPASWKDIWLNEGIASWATWFWDSEQSDNPEKSLLKVWDTYFRVIPKRIRTNKERKAYWAPGPANIERPTQMFDGAVYYRGAMTIQALYYEIGRDDLLEILQRWVADHRYGNVTTKQFIALSEEVSGRDLGHFFRVWLYRNGPPHDWGKPPPSPRDRESARGGVIRGGLER